VFALLAASITPTAQAVVNVVSGGDHGEGYAPDYHGTVYAYHLTSGTQTQATDIVQGVSFLPWNAGAAVRTSAHRRLRPTRVAPRRLRVRSPAMTCTSGYQHGLLVPGFGPVDDHVQ
jgi:hypothetical protein